LAAIVVARLVLAPYWVHQELVEKMAGKRSIAQRANTMLIAAVNYLSDQSKIGTQIDGIDEREAIRHAALNGELEIFGIKNNITSIENRLYEIIPREYWEDHHIDMGRKFLSNHEMETVNSNILGAAPEERSVMLRIDRSDFLSLWPRSTRSERRAKARRAEERRKMQRI
jgi:hypothetical protein